MDDCNPPRLSDPFRVREVYNSVLSSRVEEYSTLTDLHVGIVTLNVAQTLPEACDCQKLLQTEELYDVVAVTLQEVDMTPWAVAMEVTEWGPRWTRRVADALAAAGEYALVYEQQLVGTVLLLFVRGHLHPHVHRVQANHFRAGWLWYATTKGGIAVRFTLFGRRFLFCAQHLTPFPEGFEARCSEYAQSIATARFRLPMWADDPVDLTLPPTHPLRASLDPLPPTTPSPLATPEPSALLSVDSDMADYFFWFGDLNFRVDLDYPTALAAITRGELQPLRDADQLLKARQAGRCFVGFSEGPLSFPPTYKFDKGTTTYDTSFKRRTPSWTDRVLWACPAMPPRIRPDAGVDGKALVRRVSMHRNPDVGGLSTSDGGNDRGPLLVAAEDQKEDLGASLQAVDVLPPGPELWVEQTFYGSLPELLQSDHRPVCARFAVRCRRVDPDRLTAVLADAAKRVAGSALSDVAGVLPSPRDD
eukprot:EG_transcript_11510